MEYGCFKIPPRSLEVNLIKNLFYLVCEKMKTSARESNVHRESNEDFIKRVEKNITGMAVERIDNLISSMPNRLREVRRHKRKKEDQKLKGTEIILHTWFHAVMFCLRDRENAVCISAVNIFG